MKINIWTKECSVSSWLTPLGYRAPNYAGLKIVYCTRVCCNYSDSTISVARARQYDCSGLQLIERCYFSNADSTMSVAWTIQYDVSGQNRQWDVNDIKQTAQCQYHTADRMMSVVCSCSNDVTDLMWTIRCYWPKEDSRYQWTQTVRCQYPKANSTLSVVYKTDSTTSVIWNRLQ